MFLEMIAATSPDKGAMGTTGAQLEDIEDGPPPRPGPTPFQSSRKGRRWLSVTDLVQPTWQVTVS